MQTNMSIVGRNFGFNPNVVQVLMQYRNLQVRLSHESNFVAYSVCRRTRLCPVTVLQCPMISTSTAFGTAPSTQLLLSLLLAAVRHLM